MVDKNIVSYTYKDTHNIDTYIYIYIVYIYTVISFTKES